jgi:hypothetical protein
LTGFYFNEATGTCEAEGPMPAPGQGGEQPSCEDLLVDGLQRFLAAKRPSLEQYASAFEAVGASDNIDPRFFVAIALGENGQAKNNPFGLGPNGSSGYASIYDAIAALGATLEKYIFTWHETTVSQLWSGNGWIVDPRKPWITLQPPAYCYGRTRSDKAGCQNTGGTIAGFLTSQGGNASSLIFPCDN